MMVIGMNKDKEWLDAMEDARKLIEPLHHASLCNATHASLSALEGELSGWLEDVRKLRRELSYKPPKIGDVYEAYDRHESGDFNIVYGIVTVTDVRKPEGYNHTLIDFDVTGASDPPKRIANGKYTYTLRMWVEEMLPIAPVGMVPTIVGV